MKIENGIIYPDEGNYLKNVKSGEVYPGYIVPAKSLTESDFIEVSEEEYQAYMTAEEEILDSEALEIITGGSET